MPPVPPPATPDPRKTASPAQGAPGWTVRTTAAGSIRSVLRMREAQIAWLTPTGEVEEAGREIPAMPLFLETCSAMARGTLVAVPGGTVAVEDLMPGDVVDTVTGGPQKVVWKGSMLVRPGGHRRADVDDRLYRVPTDAMGPARPSNDLMLGGGAMVCLRTPAVRSRTGAPGALLPVGALADGAAIFSVTPAAAVEVFHLAFAGHHTFRANGVEIESFHPGTDLGLRLPRELVGVYLTLFPHLNGGGFGPLRLPRLSAEDLDDGSTPGDAVRRCGRAAPRARRRARPVRPLPPGSPGSSARPRRSAPPSAGRSGRSGTWAGRGPRISG